MARLSRLMLLRPALILLLGLAGLLVACTPTDDAPLPTLAQLPTEAAPTGTLTLAASPVSATEVSVAATETATPTDSMTQPATESITTDAATVAPTTPAESPTVTVTPSATITDTPTRTPTPIPSIAPEDRPLAGLLELAARSTIQPTQPLPPTVPGVVQGGVPGSVPGGGIVVISTQSGSGSFPQATPPPATLPGGPPTNCAYLPPGGFATIYVSNPDIAAAIGCPLGNPPQVITLAAAVQPFQSGLMLWLQGDIYVLYNAGQRSEYYADTFQPGLDPETSPETPPPNLVAPVRGFLKVWSSNPAVRDGLGWGTAPEQGTTATVQRFANGQMIALPVRGDILILIGPANGVGTWRSVPGSY